MNFRSNKGFSGVDISISIILILIFIPTIFGSIYGVQKYNNGIRRETKALSIATEIIEIAKKTEYSDLSLSNNSAFMEQLSAKYVKEQANNAFSYRTPDGDYYKIEIEISNYYPQNIEAEDRRDLIKNFNVVVTYMLSNNQQNVELNTAIQKKYI